jgi:hypothetical protein
MPNNLNNNGQCLISGNILTYEVANSGKRKPKQQEYQLKTFESYVHTNDPGLQNEYRPNKGCFININDKNEFFDTITGLAQINMYPNEAALDSTIVDLNKQKRENINMKKMASLYGINIDQDFDTSVDSKCTTYQTDLQDTGGYKYNYLDRQDIRCPDDQILSSFQLVNQDPQQKYVYTCCKPQTYDTCIRPKVTEQKTSENVPTSDFSNPWESNKKLECQNGYMNSMRLRSGYNPNHSSYVYNCSKVDKQYNTSSCPQENAKDDKRQINFYCEEKTSPMIPKFGGTSQMSQLRVDCGKSAIRNVQLVDNGGSYGYKYTCCMPRIDL